MEKIKYQNGEDEDCQRDNESLSSQRQGGKTSFQGTCRPGFGSDFRQCKGGRDHLTQ